MILNIKNNFTKELPSDPILENSRRQVIEAVFSYVNPKKTKDPKVIHTLAGIPMINHIIKNLKKLNKIIKLLLK